MHRLGSYPREISPGRKPLWTRGTGGLDTLSVNSVKPVKETQSTKEWP